jgi:hypothetical protein
METSFTNQSYTKDLESGSLYQFSVALPILEKEEETRLYFARSRVEAN